MTDLPTVLENRLVLRLGNNPALGQPEMAHRARPLTLICRWQGARGLLKGNVMLLTRFRGDQVFGLTFTEDERFNYLVIPRCRLA